MTTDAYSLMSVYKGWDDYQISIVRAIAPLSREQLAWRPAPHLRSVGEIANHIVGGRIQWFHYILGEGSAEFASQVAALPPMKSLKGMLPNWSKGWRLTWQMVEDALNRWTVCRPCIALHATLQGAKLRSHAPVAYRTCPRSRFSSWG